MKDGMHLTVKVPAAAGSDALPEMTVSEAVALDCILAFNPGNQLAVRSLGSKFGLPFTGTNLEMAAARLEASFAIHTPPVPYFSHEAAGKNFRVHFVQVHGLAADPEVVFHSLDFLSEARDAVGPSLAQIIRELDPFLVEIPYLHLGENDFIYKFRPASERNPAIYGQDPAASALYQSQLCAAIKALARQHERMAENPVVLDFGVVNYVIPSHFGFCLGVKNAIERAYETLAENPGRRVFMLSELIHNPFVNEDLLRRGLRYLQSDRGVAYTVDGRTALADPAGQILWDTVNSEDVVIIPAFGATDEDKRRLVRKGIAVCTYDATCMLVEKVWKAARGYAREGYTVIIHGKSEHEETKSTFSNTRRHGPTLIVRNLDEARLLGEIVAGDAPGKAERFARAFAGKHTLGFDVHRDLERIAVVNQTTLLMNETLGIIEHLRTVYQRKFGDDSRVGGSNRRDTLCYATQVNQDALSRALDEPLDAAFVIGGKNSSNTYQLFRLCEDKLGDQAFFIQSETDILSLQTVRHYSHAAGVPDHTEERWLWEQASGPKRVLITGGASCPDGIIQQAITRINSFFPAASLRSIDAVLADIAQAGLGR